MVPTATGRSVCAATDAIVRRGLRWRYERERAVHAGPAEHAPAGASPDPCDVPVVDQAPAPGAHLTERSVVTIRSACQGPRGTPVRGGCG